MSVTVISTDRDATIKTIRAALKRRSGKLWSVKGGRGTAWGWIEINAPPARCTWRFEAADNNPSGYLCEPENWVAVDSGRPGGYMSPAEQAELGQLLGLDGPAHCQGVDIPAGSDYRREYIDRAEGRAPSVIGQPYWD